MRRKLWLKAPSLAGALGQISKNFQDYFICINLFKNQTKKITIQPKSYTAMRLYLILNSLLSTSPKITETEKWPKAADSALNGIAFT